jgi:hypothetical protein
MPAIKNTFSYWLKQKLDQLIYDKKSKEFLAGYEHGALDGARWRRDYDQKKIEPKVADPLIMP